MNGNSPDQYNQKVLLFHQEDSIHLMEIVRGALTTRCIWNPFDDDCSGESGELIL